MERSPAATVAAVLNALADLAPSTEQRPTGLAVPTEWFRWLPIGALRLFAPHSQLDADGRATTVDQLFAANAPETLSLPIDREFGERLAAVEQLRAGQRSLRAGWLFVAGRADGGEGRSRRVFQPLVTVPVRVVRIPGLGHTRLAAAGDVEISELITDQGRRRDLEIHLEFGGGALTGEAVEVDPVLLARLDRLRH
jgi:hypothetical protein